MAEKFDVTSMSLLGRAKLKDQEAWERLVNLYGPLVHRWCRMAGLNAEDTADVFQDTFHVVSKKLDSFEPKKSIASFRSWLKTIVRTKTIDHFRKKNRQADAAGGTVAHAQMAELADPFDNESIEQSQADDALIVQGALEAIKGEFDPRNWNAFIKVVIEGHSATDVANQLGVAAQTIRQANYRIRRRLRSILEDLVDDDVIKPEKPPGVTE